ncbi:MAG: hypothetical protein NC238_15900 [Dehalobacter sp.]|nr:hypothetical protein [Dehalobacter sp.]
MEIQNSRQTSALMLILSALSLYASLRGVFDRSLYYDVYEAGTLPRSLIWGSQAQDIVSVTFAVLLAVMTLLFLKKKSMKIYIMMLGLAWYLFYAFGLYTIQGQYTSIYLIYMAIFGISFYSIVIGALSINPEEAKHYQVPEYLQKAVIIFLFIMIALLYSVWLLRLTPEIAAHVPGPTYAVFILDLCLIFPALGFIAYMLWDKKPLGIVLAGVALLKILTLCLSWAFGELSNPFAGNAFAPEMALISSTLTLVSMLLFVPYMIRLKKYQ